ncbi:MAG: WxcM-like domain-containing protein [Candidatus Gracilibacteria bacterium]|nr:WxcM-like domain-containing protein [Candidatus Gracilibacteria bacterium]
MTKSLDLHSQAKKVENIEQDGILLAKKIYLNPRDSKKGRYFIPTYDDRYSLLEEFGKIRFVYNSVFFEENNASGGHYHKVKKEILIPLAGEFEIHLIDVETKKSIVLNISAPKGEEGENVIGIYIPLGVSHKVISKNKGGVLQVLASTPSDLSDEIDFEM